MKVDSLMFWEQTKNGMCMTFLWSGMEPLCFVFLPALGCCWHPKAGQNLFFSRFSSFLVHCKAFSVISRLKSRFRPAFGCAQYPKAGHNTQHLSLYSYFFPLTTYIIFRDSGNVFDHFPFPFPQFKYRLTKWSCNYTTRNES